MLHVAFIFSGDGIVMVKVARALNGSAALCLLKPRRTDSNDRPEAISCSKAPDYLLASYVFFFLPDSLKSDRNIPFAFLMRALFAEEQLLPDLNFNLA